MTEPTGGTRSHPSFLELKDAVYDLMSRMETLLPRVTNSREREELLEILHKLALRILEAELTEPETGAS